MRMVRPLFLPWLQEVIRDEEVAVIFLKEFWPQIVGDRMAKSTAPLRLRKRTLEIGVSGREWFPAVESTGTRGSAEVFRRLGTDSGAPLLQAR